VENLVRGLEAPLSSPEGRLPASDSFTGALLPHDHSEVVHREGFADPVAKFTMHPQGLPKLTGGLLVAAPST
jgi:hypothetical protein